MVWPLVFVSYSFYLLPPCKLVRIYFFHLYFSPHTRGPLDSLLLTCITRALIFRMQHLSVTWFTLLLFDFAHNARGFTLLPLHIVCEKFTSCGEKKLATVLPSEKCGMSSYLHALCTSWLFFWGAFEEWTFASWRQLLFACHRWRGDYGSTRYLGSEGRFGGRKIGKWRC